MINCNNNSDDNKIAIFFGAGQLGEIAIGFAKTTNYKVDCFIDNDPGKWGTDFHGIQVLPPDYLDELVQNNVEIIITVGTVEISDIISQLSKKGFSLGKNIFTLWEKFTVGTIPKLIKPGYMDLDAGYTLLKPVTDCYLITDGQKKHIYRAVSIEKAELMRDVHERISMTKELNEKIVMTRIAADGILSDISPLVFEHELIMPISYAFEWPPAMLKDYVLYMLDLIISLHNAGLAINDLASWNATYCKGRFQYIDYSSFAIKTMSVYDIELFLEFYIYPLVLVSKHIERGIKFFRPDNLASFNDLSGYLDDNERKECLEMRQNCLDMASHGRIKECCILMKNYIDSISMQITSLTYFPNYQVKYYEKLRNEFEWSTKQKNVLKLVRMANPRTLLDLAGNMGWYSVVVSNDLDYAITVDIDFGISNITYKLLKKYKINNVLPACFNLVAPSPAFQRNNPISTNSIQPTIKSAMERFNCDIVLALAIEHHLIMSQGLTFEELAEHMATFTKRHLIMEFIEPNDEFIIRFKEKTPQLTTWYTKARFEKAFGKFFRTIEILEADVPTRVLYLFDKK